MKSTRAVLAAMLVVVMVVGALPAGSLAQQPQQPAAPPQPPPPVMMPDTVRQPDVSTVRPFDMYNVGAGFFTVARAPFNVAICALGVAMSGTLFILTFGSAYRGSTRVLEEGCAQPWVVRADDIRPVRGSSGIFESRMERYQER